ncbi:MAG: hypothetical protein ACYDBB_26880 [Armatimonadota bacterium]
MTGEPTPQPEPSHIPPTPVLPAATPAPVVRPGVVGVIRALLMVYWILDLVLLLFGISLIGPYSSPNIPIYILYFMIAAIALPIYVNLEKRTRWAWISGLLTVVVTFILMVLAVLVGELEMEKYTDSMDYDEFYAVLLACIFHAFFLLPLFVLLLLPSVRRWCLMKQADTSLC